MSEELAQEIMAAFQPAGTPEPEAPAPVTPAKAEPAPASAPAAPKAEPVAPQAGTQPAQPGAEPTTGHVPISALLDERERRQAAEKRAKERDERLAAYDAERNAQSNIPSDPGDPEVLARWTQDQINRGLAGAKFDWSEANARERHTDTVVESAMAWGMERSQQSQAFAAEYFKQKDPINWIVRQQKRESALSLVGDDPDAFAARRAAELGWVQPQPTAVVNGNGHVPPPTQPGTPSPAANPIPTRSIASKPAAGGSQNTVALGAEAALDEVFPT